jgi:crotonobetainyl-CoA:carnitine CoA-transferase CaiB-like acyl-CoA transferase
MNEPILQGLRVIDMGVGLAAPVAAMMLAEAGADVIKVESPLGDPGRSSSGSATWNRSKRSVVLDLDAAADRAALSALLEGADVLIHSFTPSQALRHGLDAVELAARYPHLVIAPITAYASGHADDDRRGYDNTVLARIGVTDEQVGHRPGPMFIRFPLASWGATYLSVIAVLARLFDRHRSQRGGVASTSLQQGALVPLTMHWARAERPSPAFAHGMPKEMGASIFECSDGVSIHVMRPPENTPLMQQVFLEMGGPSVIDALRSDPDTLSPLERVFTYYWANKAAFALRPSQEWLEHLWSHDIPVQPARPLGSLFFDEQAIACANVVTVDDPVRGRVLQAGQAFVTEPAPCVTSAEPSLGQHTAEVLGEPKIESRAMVPEVPRTWPLQGVRVVDFGSFLAGPMSPMLLADLGADVIKVEMLDGDAMRFVERVFAGCQRGKRSIALDLKNPDSRPVLEALIGWADVVHHNIRVPAARKLGLDEESVRAINPQAIFCHVSSYGATGPRADWPGFDQLFQASSGWEFEGAGEGNPPMWHRFGMMDHQGALASTVAVLLALLARDRDGAGQAVSASLLAASLLTTSETFVAADGSLAPTDRLDAGQTGLGPGYRMYQANDGWVMVAAVDPTTRAAMRSALGAQVDGDLEHCFADLTATDAVDRLTRAGIIAEVCATDAMDAFFDDERNVEIGLVARYEHPDYGLLEQIGALWNMADRAARLDQAPPTLGQHTVELLGELGFDAATVARLLDDRVVADRPKQASA